jgi:DNA mismatch repair protein MutS
MTPTEACRFGGSFIMAGLDPFRNSVLARQPNPPCIDDRRRVAPARHGCLMNFESILFLTPGDRERAKRASMPDYFVDLNLDQVVDRVTATCADYTLKPYYWFCLEDVDAIHYRHEVFGDLEDARIDQPVRDFTQSMRNVRGCLLQAGKLHYGLQRQFWLVDAVAIYFNGVERFANDLLRAPIKSQALGAFRDYLLDYASGARFRALVEETKALKFDLSDVRYGVHINGGTVTVRPYEMEANYSDHILKTFEKFKQGAERSYTASFRSAPEMNHIEAQILGFVAKLNSEVFGRLADYHTRHTNFVDDTIGDFDREVQFYLAYTDHIAKLRAAGLQFTYPRISSRSKEVYDEEGFDLALAQKLLENKALIVRNSFHLAGKERIIVVSGPNQGGKTTFARMIGQFQHLASLGCPVPGRDAQFFLCDRIFSHFEREEKVETFRGKLEDDLVRIHAILQCATPHSLIVLNEIFTSTTLMDEVFLSRKLMETLVERDLFAVWVTFVDELASFSEQTMSMVSTIVPDNPAIRTFKVVRRAADGLAYAMAIAEKYRVTYQRIKERIPS